MPGKVVQVLKSNGESVKAGDTLIVVEAMKMEHSLKASKDGKVSAIHCKEGAQVNEGDTLIVLE